MKTLDPESVERFNEQGYLFPIRVVSEAHARDCVRQLEAYEQSVDGSVPRMQRFKLNLLFKWADELIRNEKILDVVEDLVGPNILCWNSNLFIKEPGDANFVAWHQDSPYQGMSESTGVAAWVALEPSTVENGALKVVPGSHLAGDLLHKETDDAHNQLMRHQEIAVEVDENDAVHMVLQPGEMSVHHTQMVHGSDPNVGDVRRLGLAIRYIPTRVHQAAGSHDSVALVRGVDEYGNYQHEPRPQSDFDPVTVAFHQRYADNQASNLTRDLQSAR